MYEDAVPVYEMKNKLSFYLHKAEEEGPVFISNRGKPAFVLQTIEDYEKQNNSGPKEKNPEEIAAELRKKHEIEDTKNFDLNNLIESIKTDSATEDHRSRKLAYEFQNQDIGEEE